MTAPDHTRARDWRSRDRRARRIAARSAKGAYLETMVVRSRD